MTGKERILKVLNHEQADRIPWIPFTGVHSGLLTGFNAQEVLTDSDKLFQALLEAHKLYQPDGMPVMFDLQIEAEILGCGMLWAEKAPASVTSHPVSDKHLPDKKITKADGRIPIALNAYQKLRDAIGKDTALFGLICGPFTLASHLRGNEIFMDMFDDADFVHQLMAYTTELAKTMSEIYIEAGFDVIGVVDPLVSQISPQHFEEFFADSFLETFQFIASKNVPSAFFVCGNATRNIEVMCKTQPNSIFVDENVDMPQAKKITDQYRIAIGGNIPLTSIMLHGTQQDNMKYVIDLMDAIDDHGHLMIAPGCDMPFDTPPENVIAVQQAIRETESVREMLKNYEAPSDDIKVTLPDYASLTKPLIEVFTLDSLTCAACTYMMGAAKTAKEKYGNRVDLVEYKFTEKENIARVKKMGVKNLPSIYINGELKFSSIIPSLAELSEAIESYL